MVVDGFAARDHPGLSAAERFSRRHLLAAPLVLPRFIACDVRSLPATVPMMLRQFLDLPVLAWTVRTAGDRKRARAWADQIVFEGVDPDA
jgi:hypothetical protein